MNPNIPSHLANTQDKYPHVGLSGYLLPSGYAHFADSLHDQINRSGVSYISTFPNGENPEQYTNLISLIARTHFPIYTSGIKMRGAAGIYTAVPSGSSAGSMSNLFG
jgi:hypothetical protein